MRPRAAVPALGGLFVGHEAARALGARHIFTEKNPSGTLELRRNFQVAAREKVLVVEDVATQGGRKNGFWRTTRKSAKIADRNI